MLTVGTALTEATERLRASGSESARLDAELLLGHALSVDRTAILAHPEAPVGDGPAAAFAEAVARRAGGEPVAYIRGVKEFYGIALSVDGRVLIPRPETERLVDLALERIRRQLTAAPRERDAPPLLVWDVGTGSGAVPVALAMTLRRRGYLPEVRFLASDSSSDALAVALENVVAQGLAEAIALSLGDLLEVDPPPASRADLLLANLPYIPSADVPRLPIAARFEPAAALDGGPDGLDVIRRLLPMIPAALAPSGQVLLEIGSSQGPALARAVEKALPGWAMVVHDDLSGRPRVAQLEPPAR